MFVTPPMEDDADGPDTEVATAVDHRSLPSRAVVAPARAAQIVLELDSRFNGKSAIAFSRSTDGGKTWSPAKRIDDAGDAQAFTASVDVNADGQSSP